MTYTRLPFYPQKANRDIVLFKLTEDELLVIACDSAGGIGPKTLDQIKVDGYTLGKFTARAALMEVLAVNANPICIVDTLGVEPEPTGNQILSGIRDEAKKVGLDPELAVTGSTEKNIVVEQTGIGVTVIGTCKKDQLRIGTSKPTDVVAAIGAPCVGDEVVPAEKEGKLADTTDILKLREMRFIQDIIPVGSMGILYEAKVLAESAKLNFKETNQQNVDIRKSAGPATVLLASLPETKLKQHQTTTSKPVDIIGRLYQ